MRQVWATAAWLSADHAVLAEPLRRSAVLAWLDQSIWNPSCGVAQRPERHSAHPGRGRHRGRPAMVRAETAGGILLPDRPHEQRSLLRLVVSDRPVASPVDLYG